MSSKREGVRVRSEEWRLQGLVEVLVHLHDGGLVAASVAVVGGAEDGHHIHDVGPVVALQFGDTDR